MLGLMVTTRGPRAFSTIQSVKRVIVKCAVVLEKDIGGIKAMFLIVLRRQVERAIENDFELLIFNGAKRDFRTRVDAEDFCQEYETPEQFPGAKKRLLVSIHTAFPKARFSTFIRHSSFDAKLEGGLVPGAPGGGMQGGRLDENFINYYLKFDKEPLP